MRTRLAKRWYATRSSYWFLPTIMFIGAVLLSVLSVATDRFMAARGYGILNILPNNPEPVRLLLATLAGSMITVAGVVFSITIVSMTLASSQFGSRVLVNFMRDTGNQIVLGAFVATFFYDVLILLTVIGGDGTEIVPKISVMISIVLVVVCLGLLIFFIHHAAASIQVNYLVSKVSHDLIYTLDRFYPRVAVPPLAERMPVQMPGNFDETCRPVLAPVSGYLQVVDLDRVLKIATEKGLIVRMAVRPGKFLVLGSPIASIWSQDGVVRELGQLLTDRFITGNQRTYEQDVEFAIDQLVEIAVRALSPGINDPFTAIMCVDHLGSALRQVVERPEPWPYLLDGDRKLRVIVKTVGFADLLATALNQIRQHSRTDVSVTIRLLEVIESVSDGAASRSHREELLHHAGMIWRGSQRNLSEKSDLADVEVRYQAILRVLATEGIAASARDTCENNGNL